MSLVDSAERLAVLISASTNVNEYKHLQLKLLHSTNNVSLIKKNPCSNTGYIIFVRDINLYDAERRTAVQ